MKDFYKVLGVSRKASLSDIKKTYRRLARKYHPDLNPGDKASEKRFKEITEAYDILKDPQKRKQYDTFGTVHGNQGPQGGGFSNFEGFDFNTTGTSSFGDIFETIFGGKAGQQSQASPQTRKAERGEDLLYSINLSFEDAAAGIETPIQVVRKEACTACKGKGIEKGSKKQTCPLCNGKGRIQKQAGFMKFASPCSHCSGQGILPGESCKSCNGTGRKDQVTRIRARIPAGVDNNSKVRLHEKGNSGLFGGPPGDLIITISVTPHNFFKRNGSNLEIQLPITFTESALGAKVEVPTLDGKSLLKIPPGTPSGRKLRLKQKGIINPKTKSKGDMIIDIKITPPPTKDLEVRELLKKMSRIAPYNPREELDR